MLVHWYQSGHWVWVVSIDYPGFAHCWSRCAPLWVKILAVSALTAVCWLVHRFVQDGLVAALYVRLSLPADLADARGRAGGGEEALSPLQPPRKPRPSSSSEGAAYSVLSMSSGHCPNDDD